MGVRDDEHREETPIVGRADYVCVGGFEISNGAKIGQGCSGFVSTMGRERSPSRRGTEHMFIVISSENETTEGGREREGMSFETLDRSEQ